MSSQFRQNTESKSADSAEVLKVGMSVVFIGFTCHILFFDLFVAVFKLNLNYIAYFFAITGIPEIDLLLPLFITNISPILLLYSSTPLLFFFALIPWILAGFMTGYKFGPSYEKTIGKSIFFFNCSVLLLIFFLIFSFAGLGPGLPLEGLQTFLIAFIYLAIIAGLITGVSSLPVIIASTLGYVLGKNYTPKAVPRIFYAQPNREDPNQSKCPYLTSEKQCSQRGNFISTVCLNKYNQMTCQYYKTGLRKISKKKTPGVIIDEI